MKTVLILALVLASSAMAQVTLTMDEVATQPINGLAVTKGGITFTFSNTVGNYSYNEPNGGALSFVQDPSIEGNTSGAVGGGIGIAFSVPVFSVQFGIAESNMSNIAPIATVQLFSSSVTPFATVPFNTFIADPFAESQFNFSSATPITNILITPSTASGAAAIDNLVVNPNVISATPVPSSWLLMGIGMLALLMFYVARGRFSFRS